MEHLLKKLFNYTKQVEQTLSNCVYSLLYVTQNFYKPSALIKITYKVKLLWVLKNCQFLLTLSRFRYLDLVHDFNVLKTALSTLSAKITSPMVIDSFFDNLGHFVFKKHLKAPKTFWKINLDKSLKYNILKSVTSDANKNFNEIVPNDNYIHNQYYWPLNVANISLHNKLYRTLFITYLFFTVNYWPKLNNHFNLILKYYLVSDAFLLLTFYNRYLFKVYNF